jgi:3-hydroxybutyryl-CoA dehydrogenase
MEIKNVGVLGCGIMGSGIAQICAQAGYHVVVSEINDELLTKGMASIGSFLSKGIERGKITEKDKQAIIARIEGATDLDNFAKCDLVIEAAAGSL